jgi:hypothetical protein
MKDFTGKCEDAKTMGSSREEHFVYFYLDGIPRMVET